MERTVKPSAGVPSVVLSALAALLTSPCFFLHKYKSHCEAHTGRAPRNRGFLPGRWLQGPTRHPGEMGNYPPPLSGVSQRGSRRLFEVRESHQEC